VHASLAHVGADVCRRSLARRRARRVQRREHVRARLAHEYGPALRVAGQLHAQGVRTRFMSRRRTGIPRRFHCAVRWVVARARLRGYVLDTLGLSGWHVDSADSGDSRGIGHDG